MTESVIRDLSK